MGTNSILPFGMAANANVSSDPAWLADAGTVSQGFTAGRAPSAKANKSWKQAINPAAGLAQFAVDWSGLDFTDSLTPAAISAILRTATVSAFDGARMGVDTSTAANTITFPLSPLPTTLVGNKVIWFQPNVTNTGPTTATILKPDGTSAFNALPVKQRTGADVAAGDLVKGQWYAATCDGSKFQLLVITASEQTAQFANATYITTAITKVVGGTGADFANLNLAFAWLSNYRISLSGSVTFQMAGNTTANANAIQHVTNVDILFQHPDGARVTTKGGALLKAQPAGASLALTGNSASARASDTAANLATLRQVYATEIVLQGGASFRGFGFLGNLQDVLITSDGTGSGSNNLFWQTGRITLTRVAAVGANFRGFAFGSAYAEISGICYGMGCGESGLASESGSAVSILAGSMYVGVSNTRNGCHALFGFIGNGGGGTGTAYCSLNGDTGVYTLLGGHISLPSTAVASFNANNGFANSGGKLAVAGTTAQGNGFAGYTSNNQSFTDASSTSGANNGSYGYYALNAAVIIRPGGSATGATAAASPAVGATGGNNASFIF